MQIQFAKKKDITQIYDIFKKKNPKLKKLREK